MSNPTKTSGLESEYRQNWKPKFLCRSFKSPIILSDGKVTSCTLDRMGRNTVGSIYDDDFETLIARFGQQRMDAMADPLSKPLCHSCFTRLPRWQEQEVPRTGWISESISEESKMNYLALFKSDALSMNIELSSACNLQCTGCSHAEPTTFRPSRQTVNIDIDRLMAWMQGRVQKIEHIRLYHMGETWLHPRWFEFCIFLRQNNPSITLFTSTNGMPLDTEEKLQNVADSGINHVMFSIHGATQASTQAYMGKAFQLQTALDAARRLVELRANRLPRLYLSWKYLLFDWNDSDEEIELAMRLCDEIGFDELHFSITSQPAPSKRYNLNGPAWASMRAACSAAWSRSADYQRTAPMTAIYPGRDHRTQPVDLFTQNIENIPKLALVTNSTGSAQTAQQSNLASEAQLQGRKLLDSGHVLEAVRMLTEVIENVPETSFGVHATLGYSLLAGGRFKDALASFEVALSIDPTQCNEHFHLSRARALRAIGQNAEAEHAYEMALRLRECSKPGLYGEDIYLELRETSLALGHEAAADNAWRLWMESYWLADTHGRTIYCPIAKNACTFMKVALAMNSKRRQKFLESGQDGHVFTRTRENALRLGEIRLLKDRSYFSFVLLRDPFERLASAYCYNFVRPLQWRSIPDAPARPIVNAVHLSQGKEPDWSESISFAQFINYIVSCSDAELDHHWRPQSAFFNDIKDFSHVGCVENIEKTMKELAERRRWQFDFDQAKSRNALRRTPLPRAEYATMSTKELATLPGFPTVTDLFTEELRELVAVRYSKDICLHAQVMGDPEPIYPTGGALFFL
jgi:tetratricopeptide (TPR) repeat protein